MERLFLNVSCLFYRCFLLLLLSQNKAQWPRIVYSNESHNGNEIVFLKCLVV